MAGSVAERQIRDAVATWFRDREPQGRVVHELKTGQESIRRADLAIVFPDFLVMVEIKSERDVLKRLEDQFREFQQCSHFALIVAHEKHFDGDGLKGQKWMSWSHREHLWCYPDPAVPLSPFRWQFNRYMQHIQPNSYRLLELLWAEELRAVCSRHRVACDHRSVRWMMIRDLQLTLTGDEVRRAVCHELRNRSFAEADPPTDAVTAPPAPKAQVLL